MAHNINVGDKMMIRLIMITMMIMIINKNRQNNCNSRLVVCISVIGPFEEPGLQATFESVR